MRRAASFLLVAALAGCNGGADGSGPSEAALVLLPLNGGESPAARIARVEVASTPAAREHGLMSRDRLPPDTGMLFAYPEVRDVSFWMKDCRHPLSVAFLDAEGRIAGITEMAAGAGIPDQDLPRYPSKGPIRFALEMDSGWFAAKGIGVGDRVDTSLAMRGVVPR